MLEQVKEATSYAIHEYVVSLDVTSTLDSQYIIIIDRSTVMLLPAAWAAPYALLKPYISA